jgi:AcrR family transcriptional regulator
MGVVLSFHGRLFLVARKDLVRNRQRLLDAAMQVFTESGSQASLEEVARCAGVGISTLYRHFPTRDDLVEAVLKEFLVGVQSRAEELEAIGDPRTAFRSALTGICDLDSAEIGAFADLADTSSRTEQFARGLVLDVIGPTVGRLADAGGLRDDVSADDIVTLIRMVESTPASPEQRQLALEVMLDGLIV